MSIITRTEAHLLATDHYLQRLEKDIGLKIVEACHKGEFSLSLKGSELPEPVIATLTSLGYVVQRNTAKALTRILWGGP